MAPPELQYGVLLQIDRVNGVRVKAAVETGDRLAFPAHGVKGLRMAIPPVSEKHGSIRAFVYFNEFLDSRFIVTAGRLDGILLRSAGEEGFAYDRVLDEIEHVSGITPEFPGTRLSHLSAQLPPC
jgi:hypothetical protein